MKDEAGHHSYFYGDLDDYEPEDLEGYTKVTEDEYTADDIAEIFGNILEDNNRHSMTSLGNEIVASLRETTNLSDKEIAAFMLNFVDNFITNHNLF